MKTQPDKYRVFEFYLRRGLGALVVLVLVLAPKSYMTHAAGSTTYTVDKYDDENDGSCTDGDCSLRDAITLAKLHPGADTIEFAIPGCPNGVCFIAPTSALPVLSGGETTIDGYSQPLALPATETVSATLTIVIDGNLAGENVPGLEITSSDNRVEGLVIRRFSGDGIHIHGNATGNTIAGNYIGVSFDGTHGMGNGGAGIHIGDSGGIQNNTIGGDSPAERNIISDNDLGGIMITGSDTTGNIISGNYIGTDANGTADRGNTISGVTLWYARNNTIGGDTPGERNVISGNPTGVLIAYGQTRGNKVSGNYIGVDASGASALSNDQAGIKVTDAAENNTIGGDTAGERNIISGNQRGVTLDLGAHDNTILGNYIGVGADGTSDIGNDEEGILLESIAKDNTIGGDSMDEGNVIARNKKTGVKIVDSGTNSNIVLGNYIGTNPSGTINLGNSEDGVKIGDGASNNTVGPKNIIAFNGRDGVRVNGSTTVGNLIAQNSIYANIKGINLLGGANGGILPPQITFTLLGSANIVGSACPGCTVELFENSDTDGEGETYIGSTVADITTKGFILNVSHLGSPFLTATATDFRGTSEFPVTFTSLLRFLFLPQIYVND